MDIRLQIERGILVCPLTHRKLRQVDEALVSPDSGTRYPIHSGVPVLLAKPGAMAEYARSSQQMSAQYSQEYLNRKNSWLWRLRTRDYRTKESIDALTGLFSDLPSDAVSLSIGGGPARAHPALTNLNIAPFPNVDLVGDAHALPYATASVDRIYCEAVLEHLHSPIEAVQEMARVLKPGGKAYVCTPFLQQYHGYPHHYQNFTLTGHVHLFRSQGFEIIEAGTCVGPVFTLRTLIGEFIREYFAFPFNKLFGIGWAAFSLAIGPLDKLIARSKRSHMLASTTYLVARLPAGTPSTLSSPG